ncbi:hypothetical protein ACTXT7_006668 [Hymenolepis weldensis]
MRSSARPSKLKRPVCDDFAKYPLLNISTYPGTTYCMLIFTPNKSNSDVDEGFSMFEIGLSTAYAITAIAF